MAPADVEMPYAAPEVLHAVQQQRAINAQAAHDMWTLGVLAYETLTGTQVCTSALQAFDVLLRLLDR